MPNNNVKRPFTVVMYVPCMGSSSTLMILAEDPEDAARKGRAEAAINRDLTPVEIVTVGVFKGTHFNEYVGVTV